MKPKNFVEMVADVRLPAVFNPYVDVCPIYDRNDAPGRRRANLEQFLRVAIEAPELSVWIGRDLGYRGGRRTGIALTDEAHLDRVSKIYAGRLELRKATHGPVVVERTASVFWEMIGQLEMAVFTWNIFPLHPHEPDNPLSNRCHSRRERNEVAPILKELLEILRPEQVIAIGNDADSGLREIGVDCLKVRHPSYGGISEFRSGVALAHGLEDKLDFSTQPSLL